MEFDEQRPDRLNGQFTVRGDRRGWCVADVREAGTLLRLRPWEIEGLNAASEPCLRDLVAAALLRERGRALSGAWTYDPVRHKRLAVLLTKIDEEPPGGLAGAASADKPAT